MEFMQALRVSGCVVDVVGGGGSGHYSSWGGCFCPMISFYYAAHARTEKRGGNKFQHTYDVRVHREA